MHTCYLNCVLCVCYDVEPKANTIISIIIIEVIFSVRMHLYNVDLCKCVCVDAVYLIMDNENREEEKEEAMPYTAQTKH